MKKIIKNILGSIYYNLYKKYFKNIGNRILLYHSIGSKLPHDSYGISISPKSFEEHLKFLKDNFEIIPINENYQKKLDEFTLSITLDDGYKDNLTALEIFDKYDIPFILFITTDFVGKKYFLNENDIKIMAEHKLCQIGSHGKSHIKLGEVVGKIQDMEIYESKKKLENITGKDIKFFSYPHGSFDKKTIEILRNRGYEKAFSSIIGINTIKNFNPHIIKRIEILASDNLRLLHKKIMGYYDYLVFKCKL